MEDPGNDNVRSWIQMYNANTTMHDYGCNTGLIRIATDNAGLYPWLILRQIRECVTWALKSCFNCIDVFAVLRMKLHKSILQQ